jgi:hypothetical protein
MKRTLLENKSSSQLPIDTSFMDDELCTVFEQLYLTFSGIFSQFAFMGVDETGKTQFDEAESYANIQLNQLFRDLKTELTRLLKDTDTFVVNAYILKKVRYLANDPDYFRYVDKITELYTEGIDRVPEQFRPVIQSQYSAFIWLVRGLNTALYIYNTTEPDQQKQLPLFKNIPEPIYFQIQPNDFKQWFDNFIKKIQQEYSLIVP